MSEQNTTLAEGAVPERLIDVAHLGARNLGRARLTRVTFREFSELHRTPVVRQIDHAQYQALSPAGRARSKNTGLVIAGAFRDGARSSATLIHRGAGNIDIDDSDRARPLYDELRTTGRIAALEGLAYFAHTTRSHTPEKPRLRIVVPFSRDVLPSEYEATLRAVAVRLDPTMNTVTRESYVTAQGMFLPSVSRDQEYLYQHVDGEPFDVDNALARYPADQPATWPKSSGESVSAYCPAKRITHPEEKKQVAPLVTAVHRLFPPEVFIDEFLGDYYVPSDDGRYSSVGATGAPSVRIYEGAFIHSDHGSDPAVGQHNCFDKLRILAFGHLDKGSDTAALPPPEWPSYRAAEAFLLAREDVREMLAEVKLEAAAERNQALLDALGGDEDEIDEFEDLIGDDATDEEDLIGDDEVDEFAALIGDDEPVKDVGAAAPDDRGLEKARGHIRKAASITDLQARLEPLKALPLTVLTDVHRDILAKDVQQRMKELGADLTRGQVRKLLSPTFENLRQQTAGQPLPEFLRPMIYVSRLNVFLNTDTGEVWTKDGFNGRFNRRVAEAVGGAVNDLGLSKVTAYEVATEIYPVRHAFDFGYQPNGGELFIRDDVVYANTYRGPRLALSDGRRIGVELLLRLVRELMPDTRDNLLLLDAFAHMIRHPEIKLNYAVVLKGCENEGKSTLANILRACVGAHNSIVLGTEHLGENFNGWVARVVVAVVEEIRMNGRDSVDVMNKLKPVITNREVAVRRMRQEVITERNYCNLFMTTNYEDCLPVERDNTRYLILFTRFRTNEEVAEWRQQFVEREGYDLLDELYREVQECPGQFLEFFRDEYEFSEHYKPGARAPKTRYLERVAEDSKTDERQLLEDFLAEGNNPAISGDVLLWSEFRAELDARGLAPGLRSRGVASFLKPMGFVRAQAFSCRVGGAVRSIKVWTRNTRLLDADGVLTGVGKQRVLSVVRATGCLDDDDARATKA